MNRIKRSQSGSALIIILLIMAGIGTIILTVAKTVREVSRSSRAADSATQAYQMASAGIDEGLLRMKLDGSGVPLGLLQGEYGEGTVNNLDDDLPYSLKPMRRGFTLGSNCGELSVDQKALFTGGTSTYDPDCPYFDLVIRDTVYLDFGSTSAKRNSLTFTKRELPQGQEVILNIKKRRPFKLTPNVSFTGSISYKECSTYGATICATTITSPGPSVINFPLTSTTKSIALTVNGSQIGQLVLTGISPSGRLAIGKGYTTIESTGYAGGVKKTLRMTVRPYDGNLTPASPTRNLLETAQLVDDSGLEN